MKLGDVIETKKPHPCGGTWRIVRIGADWKIECLTCGHSVLMEKDELERRIRRVLSEEI